MDFWLSDGKKHLQNNIEFLKSILFNFFKNLISEMSKKKFQVKYHKCTYSKGHYVHTCNI